MKKKISKLGLKTQILIFSILAFMLAVLTYYWLFVYLEKSTGRFCKTHYCLTIIPTEGYIGIVLGIISLAAVVVSLDSWKASQRYLEYRELLLSTRSDLQNIKDELMANYHNNYVDDNHLKFISIVARSANIYKDLGKLKISIKVASQYSDQLDITLMCMSDRILKNDQDITNQTISRNVGLLLAEMQKCIVQVDQLIEKTKI